MSVRSAQVADVLAMRRNVGVTLIAASPTMAALNRTIARVACTTAKVLITGESGVGKELVAQAIHSGSPRARRPFLAINCAGLAETLLESELFGHVKGSFTGAYRDKPGKLELADGGTLFLDEVGEMSLRMQGLLLRVLETGEMQRVGADASCRHVDVRIVSATNRDLHTMVVAGQFRQDLYYRLNVVRIVVPPLRERREDIAALAVHFLRQFCARDGSSPKSFSPECLALLVRHSWPGNVRELENVIEQVVINVAGDVIRPEDLPPDLRTPERADALSERERDQCVVDELYERLTKGRQSFWNTVYPLYMEREITRATVRELVDRGLKEAHGSYKVVTRLFNIEHQDYRRFINFLRKHGCQLPFREYRLASDSSVPPEPKSSGFSSAQGV